MIERKLFYLAECDGCGEPLEADNYFTIHHAEKYGIIEELEESGWVKRGREWFCPKCLEKGK